MLYLVDMRLAPAPHWQPLPLALAALAMLAVWIACGALTVESLRRFGHPDVEGGKARAETRRDGDMHGVRGAEVEIQAAQPDFAEANIGAGGLRHIERAAP